MTKRPTKAAPASATDETVPTEPMKIVGFEAENYMRLSAVSIRPDGNLVPISGENGQGKTSVLNAIRDALQGKGVIQKEPIRAGAERATIKLDLGTVYVTRTFARTKDGETTTAVMVEAADGRRFKSPQDFLNGIVGELAFDPIAFADQMNAKEQYDCLKALVPGVDFAAIEKANEDDFERRTDVNRRAKELRAREAGFNIPIGAPTERINDSDLLTQIERAADHNGAIDRSRFAANNALEAVERDIEAMRGMRHRVDTLKSEIEKLENEANKLEADSTERKAAAEKQLQDIPQPIDIAHLRAAVDTARAHNAVIDMILARQDITADAEIAESEAEELTTAIDARKAQMSAAVEAARLPVGGLELGDKTVLLNGVPFDQASDAERVNVSIAIAAAMNPTLRVIRVRDGSRLDRKAMERLATFADENNMQIWVERVGADDKIGFVIEDGHVKSSVAKAAE